MPRPIGDDRVIPLEDGCVLLCTQETRNWIARKAQTQVSAEYPGTAVIWEDEIWEVLEIERKESEIQYRLAPWDPRHAIRQPRPYSIHEDATRQKSEASEARSNEVRILLILLSPLSGLLPGHVQERFTRLHGSPRLGLTLISLILPFILGTIGVLGTFLMMASKLGDGSGSPPSFLDMAFLNYLFIESLLRFGVAMTDGRPTGSALLVVPYWILARWTGWLPAPPQQKPEVIAPMEDEHILEDRFSMLEPLLSLLPPADQLVLEQRFPYKPFRWGKRTSTVILVLMAAQAADAVGNISHGPITGGHAFISLALATFLSLEQIYRLTQMSQGNLSGSVLGYLVRPLARPLLR